MIKYFLFACLFFMAGLLFSAPSDSVLLNRLRAIQTMQAKFSETVTANGEIISKSKGEMFLERPGLFRWVHQSPPEKLVVSDGKKLWMYDVELEQVTVKPFNEVTSNFAALFLSREVAYLHRDFLITSKKISGDEVFFLKARHDKTELQKIHLFFHGKTLHKIILFDPLGQKTEISFHDVQQNIVLSHALFQFSPPKDVDVVTQ